MCVVKRAVYAKTERGKKLALGMGIISTTTKKLHQNIFSL